MFGILLTLFFFFLIWIRCVCGACKWVFRPTNPEACMWRWEEDITHLFPYYLETRVFDWPGSSPLHIRRTGQSGPGISLSPLPVLGVQAHPPLGFYVSAVGLNWFLHICRARVLTHWAISSVKKLTLCFQYVSENLADTFREFRAFLEI